MDESEGRPMSQIERDRQQDASQGSLALSLVGALLGAAVGAGVYFALMYFTGYRFAYVAILVGVAAGGGAKLLGRKKSIAAGLVAAVLGLAGVAGAEYAFFRIYPTTDKALDDVAKEQGLTLDAEQREVLRATIKEGMASISFVDYLKMDTKSTIYMAGFGIAGLVAGFMVASGYSRKKAEA